MRYWKGFAAVLFAMTITVGSSGQFQPPNPCSAFVEKALSDAHALKPGMTRRDVEIQFEPEGLTDWSKTEYTYRECPFIHLEIVFTKPGTGSDLDPNDRIESVSKPYLDYPVPD